MRISDWSADVCSSDLQQRVAVARALANRPALVLADEPTGNLDEHTADIVFAEFLRLVREEGSAAVVATHNERLAKRMDRVLRLHERSEEHTSELQSLIRISYAVSCLKKKNTTKQS